MMSGSVQASPRLRPRRSSGLRSAALAILVAISACGGDGNNPAPADQAVVVGTLAYVQSECHENAEGTSATGRQALKIRQSDGGIVVVADFPHLGPVNAMGACRGYGESHDGPSIVLTDPLQRLGVSPDGSTVVFEVTDDFSMLLPDIVPPEQEGIFAVRADGGGLRKLGPQSRDPAFRVTVSPSGLVTDSLATGLAFSPGGDQVVFTDHGPGPDGQDAVQVITLDLTTGLRRQVTRLPPLMQVTPLQATVNVLGFVDEDQIVFLLVSTEDRPTYVIVHADGSGEISRETAPLATGGGFIPQFLISQSVSFVLSVSLPLPAVNPFPGSPFSPVQEIFAVAGDNRLQLTRFGRSDTGVAGTLLSPDGSGVLFTATADPFGTNADGNCQFFSLDALGGDLRQVTTLSNGEHNAGTCSFPGTGCNVLVVGQDLATDAVVFTSTCDPLSGSSASNDVFAMRFDASGLERLTASRGLTIEPDGSVDVELPGPFGYPQVFR